MRASPSRSEVVGCQPRVRRIRDESAGFTVFDLSERLRTRGWIVPAYTFPANLEHVAVLRVVVRNGFSKDLADLLFSDLQRHVRALSAHPRSHVPMAPPVASAFKKFLMDDGTTLIEAITHFSVQKATRVRRAPRGKRNKGA